MTKRERKRARRELSRRYKMAYLLHIAFRERYLESLLATAQVLPTTEYRLQQLLVRRKRLEGLRKVGDHKQMVAVLSIMSCNVQGRKDELVEVEQAMDAAIETYRKAEYGLRLYPSVQELKKDLAAIELDFVKWSYDKAHNALVVRTEPITLEHQNADFKVNFNEFDIHIYLDGIANDVQPPYTITSPNEVRPVRGGTDFIHPHVRNSQLCEGDGARSSELFLSRGLLQDFLVLIHQILSTYNPDGPHCQLAYWTDDKFEEGMDTDEDTDEVESCNGCGNRAHRDDMGICEECSEPYCTGCFEFCDTKGRTLCTTCIKFRQENRRACYSCQRAGSKACLLWQNEPCEDCDTVPDDSEVQECDHDSELVLCKECASARVAEPCEDCDTLGKSGCLLIEFGYSEHKEEDEQKAEEPAEPKKEEGTQDGRELEGRAESTVTSSGGKLQIFDS